jgi:hypothetical protein
MDKASILKAYFRGLEKSSYQDVIKLFSPKAIVNSPLYGQVEAFVFYKELFSDTNASKILLKNIFINPENPNTAAVHFIYFWTLKDGNEIKFECVDVFDFVPRQDKIQSLTIIYDTYQRRASFSKLKEKKLKTPD